MYAVVNPATGDRSATFDVLGDAALERTLDAASAMRLQWPAEWVPKRRAELIRAVGDLHLERCDDLAGIIVREIGKPIAQARGEVEFVASIYRYYADNSEGLLADEPIELSYGSGSAIIRRSPFGVILGVMPWNFPYYQVARFAAPNLLIGNPVLLKPALQCPESAAAIQRMFDDAGFPAGAFTTVYVTHDQVAAAIADPRVAGVSVTGSERAGAAVAEIAGRNLKKVVLELGGSDPFILLGTDDLEAAVAAAAEARLSNAGQACNAAKRFIVIEELYEPFVTKLAATLSAVRPGDPASSATTLGPLSSAAAAEHLADQVRRAVEQGATLVTGGERRDAFFTPAILADVRPENEVYREELFGPVAVVHRVASEEAAVALANDTPYGLGAYVFATDAEQAQRVADRIEAGMVYVNVVGADAPELPFGGIKRSGYGRELGRLGADEFVNKKLIRVAG